MALLDVKNLTTSFYTREGRVVAVDDVSFSLEQGKVLGIVGESGSGKSVSCYSLLGLIPKPPGKIDAGEAHFEGQDLLTLNEKELQLIRGHKINVIFQDPMTSLNPYMTVQDQLIEPLLLHKKMHKTDAVKKAVDVLVEVGITDAAKRIKSYPHEFSGGMRQRVMIAMALITDPDVIIADEPTTALDVTVQAQILRLLRNLQDSRKLSIIFITHDLSLISHFADHLLVMKDGKIVEQGSADTVLHNPQHTYTQDLLAAIPSTAKPAQYSYSQSEKPLVSIKNVSKLFYLKKSLFGRGADEVVAGIHDITIDLNEGEILGLVGESGSGKSTLGRTILRLFAATKGEIFFAGSNIVKSSGGELRHVRKHMQMIFQDPYSSLNPRQTVFATLAEPMLLHGIANKNNVLEKVNLLMDDVGLDRRFIRKYPHEFSGGQRQRIAIGRALAVRPKLIIADEPVSALDVTVQAKILQLLLELTKKYQLTMLFISHDLSVVRYLCDRVVVMQQGKIVEQNDTETLFEHPQHAYTQHLLNAIPSLPTSNS